MKISIVYDYKDIKDSEYLQQIKQFKKEIRNCIKTCLEIEQIVCNICDVYVKFTTNEEIRKINNEFRNIDKPTDVLSFPMYERQDLLNEVATMSQNEIGIDTIPPITLGDIVISVPKITKQAKEYNHSFKRELIYLTTHSMFHLLGYDHMKEEEKKIMRAKEDEVMEKLGIID